MAAATRGKRIGTQGSSRGIYEVVFEGKTEYISVEISSNGYIVSANPTNKRDVGRFLKGGKNDN